MGREIPGMFDEDSSDVNLRGQVIDELRDAGTAARPALRVIKDAAARDTDEEVRGMAKQLAGILEKPNP